MANEENTLSAQNQKVSVVGLGYVGLPLALLLVEKGFDVIGIDIDIHKIDQLNKGNSYITDIDNQSINEMLSTNRFKASDQFNEIRSSNSIIICVPTPLTSYHTPDLTYLQQVGKALSQNIRRGQLVILESSTYPGTTKEVLLPTLEKSGLKVGTDIYLAYSPERVDPGNNTIPVNDIPKVISGVTKECASRAEQLYSQIFSKLVMVSSPEIAEMTKLVENCHRFINISFMNELACICDTMNIDIWEVIQAASTKPYGFTPFYPGPGIGGHCIPVDPLYLSWKAKQSGLNSKFIELSEGINHIMPSYIVNKLKEYIYPKLISESCIFIYGVAYKRDINDVRESSALKIIQLLKDEGASIDYHDPYIPQVKIGSHVLYSQELTPDQLKKADAVILFTDHSNAPIQLILDNSPLVFDTRNTTYGLKGNAQIYRLGGGRN